jgi:Na+-transporting methylmalonyl-CoA/oxaloacetate decarboxylase gamma subunit
MCPSNGGLILIKALWIVLLGMGIIFVILGVQLGTVLLITKLPRPKAKEKSK